MESTESQSSSSEIFSQDTQYCNCSMSCKRRWQRAGSNLRNSKIESSSCRCTTTSMGQKDGNLEMCVSNSIGVKAYAKRFPKGHWSFFGPGTEETWYGTHTCKPEGSWNLSAEMIMFHLRGQHPFFRATSALDRGSLKSKNGGMLSIHHNGDLSTAQLSFRTIISINQFSVYGAISDWCEELAQQILDHSFSSTEKPVANVNAQLDCRLSPEVLSILTNPHPINVPAQGNLLRSVITRDSKICQRTKE